MHLLEVLTLSNNNLILLACRKQFLAEVYGITHEHYSDDGYSRDPDVDNLYRYFLKSDYRDEYYSDDEYSRDPDVDNLYRYFLKSDYRDEYYSDDEYSRDPDVDNLYRYFLKSDYRDEYYSDDEYSRDPDVDNLYRYFLKSDYSDEYYSDDDDEYSRDPDVDYTDTICYQPGLSTRSSCASGAFHHGISPQPLQCQPNSSSGKSLAKQDPQNRSYPKPRKKARKRHKKVHLHQL
jgi:hypothetical protein